MNRLAGLLPVALLILAGCTATAPEGPGPTTTAPADPEPMIFEVHGLPAVHQGHGLYEPTIDVSPSGVIYVSAHSTGVDVQGAPAYYSKDDGATWVQLPFAATASAPSDRQAGTPPPSDEIFIVAADDGTAWGVDITLGTYPVHGWCDDGARNCYYNANAYDRSESSQAACAASSLNDRPWAAHASGTLLMVNNPGGGPVQVGSMKVPPAQPAGVANPATGPTWNRCAGSGGFIPGIPDMRPDLFFAVPQVQGDRLAIITGHADDVMTVEEHGVMAHSNKAASEVGDYGQVAFDAADAMFVAAMNNSGTTGEFQVAVSLDDGEHFVVEQFAFDRPVSSLYIDGNRWGPGVLANWGVVDEKGTDWYFGHLFFEAGKIVLRNVYLAVDDGPEASRHVQGAAVGPDGRAYMVMSEVSGNDDAAMAQAIGTKPMSVVVQVDGAKLPVGSTSAAP